MAAKRSPYALVGRELVRQYVIQEVAKVVAGSRVGTVMPIGVLAASAHMTDGITGRTRMKISSSMPRTMLPLAVAAFAVVVIAPGVTAATTAKKPPAPTKTTPTKTTPATATLTLTASKLQVVYGGATVLTGALSSKVAGETVTVLAQAYGAAKSVSLGTVTTTTNGAWSYSVKPTIGTSYDAQWKSVSSPKIAVGVRPLGSFHVLTANRFSTRLVAAHSFAGKYVQFQRRSSLGQWVTLKRMQLNANSASIFRPALPAGTSTLRVSMSVNQAGPGYLAGISRTISYHRN